MKKIFLIITLILFLGCAAPIRTIVPEIPECPKIITYETEHYIYEGDFDPIEMFNSSTFIGQRDDLIGHIYVYKQNTDENLPISYIAFLGKLIKGNFNIEGYSYYKGDTFYSFVFTEIPYDKSGYVQVLPRLK